MDLSRRWEERAERRADEARREAPAWFDLERAPSWLFVLTGIVFLVLGLNSLLDARSAWDTAWAVFGLAVLVPAQFLTAYRLRRGIPLIQPWPRRGP
jgi:uncharacterized membrane protein HdeD (DUF308 family)